MTEQSNEPAVPEVASPRERDEQEAMVSNPAEVIRLVNMLQALMSEVREIELDESGRKRLFDIQRSAVGALKDLVSDELEEELEQLGLPLEDEEASGSELRLAQAQLVGWLNGLFQGIQAAVMAQQAGSAQQLQQLRQQRPQLAESHGGQYL